MTTRSGATHSETDDGHAGRSHAPVHDDANGPELLGEHTLWWALAGLLIGAGIGAALGLLVAYDRVALPRLAPMAAGGTAGVSFAYASVFAAILGFAGGLLGISFDDPPSSATHADHDSAKHSEHKASQGWHQQLPLYGALGLALFRAYTLYVIG